MKIPQQIGPEAKDLHDRLMTEYGIDDEAGLLLLRTACEAFQRMRDCQAAIERDGVTILDRFGQLKQHPLLAGERDARGQMMSALKQLNLDLEPLRDGPGRPAGV